MTSISKETSSPSLVRERKGPPDAVAESCENCTVITVEGNLGS